MKIITTQMNMEENAQNLTTTTKISSKPQSKKEFFELFQKEDQSEDSEERAGGSAAVVKCGRAHAHNRPHAKASCVFQMQMPHTDNDHAAFSLLLK